MSGDAVLVGDPFAAPVCETRSQETRLREQTLFQWQGRQEGGVTVYTVAPQVGAMQISSSQLLRRNEQRDVDESYCITGWVRDPNQVEEGHDDTLLISLDNPTVVRLPLVGRSEWRFVSQPQDLRMRLRGPAAIWFRENMAAFFAAARELEMMARPH